MKFQIGWLVLKTDTTMRKYEQVARYDHDIVVPAGKYPVMAEYEYHERDKHYTNKIANTSVSICCQCKDEKYNMYPYAYQIAKDILRNSSNIELLPEFEARQIDFKYDGESVTSYGIFAK